jgi:DNA replication factor GINS
MYSELHDIWKQELESAELQKLSPDFYLGVADYLRRLKEEGRMLDKRAAKTRLLQSEMRNVKHMLRELVRTRYKKLIRALVSGENISSEFLTIEEKKICTSCSPIVEAYQSFARSLLNGQISSMEIVQERKTTALRFLKDVPEIIGADMRTYGPFKVEDLASLPVENAKILIRQCLAGKVEAG